VRRDGDRRVVAVLGTGGTIAGSRTYEDKRLYRPATRSIDDLLRDVVGLPAQVELRSEQVLSVGSQDMDDAAWVALSGRVIEWAGLPNVAGIVIAHGTDTLEETAFFLDLVIHMNVPVVLTGAMVPRDDGREAVLNLRDAIGLALDPEARSQGVLVAMNGEIFSARTVTKSRTIGAHAFSATEGGVLAVSRSGSTTWMRRNQVGEPRFSVPALPLPRVDVLYAHAGMSPDLLEAAVERGAQGIVVAGVGQGNFSTASLDVIRRLVTQVPVIRSTRVGAGSVLPGVEIDDEALGTIAGMGLNPAKARILLKLALADHADQPRIRALFESFRA